MEEVGWAGKHFTWRNEGCKESQLEVLLRKVALVCLLRAERQSLRLPIFSLSQAFSSWRKPRGVGTCLRAL